MIDERIATLQAEQSTLQAAILALETEQRAINGRLDALLAQAERAGGESDVIAAREAESAVTTLGQELRRKRAALAACESDLAAATAERAAGERAKVKGDLIAMFTVYEDLATALDQDIGNTDLWVRLAKTVDDANHLYMTRLYKAGADMPVRLLIRPLDVRRKIFDALGARLDRAMGLMAETPSEVTPSVALEVEFHGKRVRNL